jgi:hypothetical protein
LRRVTARPPDIGCTDFFNLRNRFSFVVGREIDNEIPLDAELTKLSVSFFKQ